MIQCTDVSYSYPASEGPGVMAVDNVSLAIAKGEFVAIIGHNGSGKSTLAKLFNGLLLPQSGQIQVDGKLTADPEQNWQIRQQVGLVFQNPDNQLIATIVEEDVAFGPENLGLPPREIRARVAQSLSQVGMEDYRLHAPHLLSGGQKQRVAIAGILAMGPQYLVLDEPTAMLDPQGRKEVMNTVLRLNRESAITVVWITHHMEEAVNAHRIVVMDQGKVALEGSPSEVFRRAEFLESLALAVPTITRLGQMLAADGFTLPPAVLSVEEMVSLLCP
mgnify:CR=1 FL=1